MSDRDPELHYRATHDPLTGLLNRDGWWEAIEPRRPDVESGGEFAVAEYDLDRFKPVNDKLGHDKGDEVLRTFGGILASNTRHDPSTPYQDITANARPGGDEMWSLFDLRQHRDPDQEFTPEERVARIVGRIRASFREYVASDEDLTRERLDVSIGTAVARQNVTVEELLSEADEAVKLDKDSHLLDLDASGIIKLHAASVLLGEVDIHPRELDAYLEKYPFPED